MWVLQLNMMRNKAESITPVALAETKEELEEFIKDQTVPAYRDEGYFKNFKQGGPLEWFNPPSEDGTVWIDVYAIYEFMSEEEFISRVIEERNDFINSLFDCRGYN